MGDNTFKETVFPKIEEKNKGRRKKKKKNADKKQKKKKWKKSKETKNSKKRKEKNTTKTKKKERHKEEEIRKKRMNSRVENRYDHPVAAPGSDWQTRLQQHEAKAAAADADKRCFLLQDAEKNAWRSNN